MIFFVVFETIIKVHNSKDIFLEVQQIEPIYIYRCTFQICKTQANLEHKSK